MKHYFFMEIIRIFDFQIAFNLKTFSKTYYVQMVFYQIIINKILLLYSKHQLSLKFLEKFFLTQIITEEDNNMYQRLEMLIKFMFYFFKFILLIQNLIF